MSVESNIDKITQLAEGIAQALGLTLVDARFGQEGRRRSLSITILRAGGRIAFEDCEKVSAAVSEALDGAAPPLIEGSYLLEVQSPGLSRTLTTDREFHVFNGSEVEILLKDSLTGLGNAIKGVLLAKEGPQIKIGRPSPLALPKKGKAAKKATAEESPPVPAELDLELSRVIHVRLYASELSGKAT